MYYTISHIQIFDRSVVTTTDVERKCVTPLGLQAAIDKLVAQVNCGRSFVRLLFTCMCMLWFTIIVFTDHLGLKTLLEFMLRQRLRSDRSLDYCVVMGIIEML